MCGPDNLGVLQRQVSTGGWSIHVQQSQQRTQMVEGILHATINIASTQDGYGIKGVWGGGGSCSLA